MKKPVLIVIILVAILAIAAGVYFFVLPKGEPEAKRSAYTPGEFFVTNIKDSLSLVKVTIVLEVDKDADDTAFHEFLKTNNHIIRDTIVFILRDKTEEELRSDGIRDALAQEMTTKINEKLDIDNVKTIYFNDYVVQ